MLDRRQFLLGAALPPPSPRVAAIVTSYYYYSHADVIAGRILDGYAPDGRPAAPRTRIVSMYTDQVHPKDLSRERASRHGFRIWPTVEEALTLGGRALAVDAVLLIGEHGDYPVNDRGQKLYPRHELFQRIAGVFRESRRSVPLFCDKHLSFSWQRAKEMYDTARRLRAPFMAGSSIPVTLRRPELELPAGCAIENAVSVGYGEHDAYGFHTLEALQCMVERRKGGETGVRSVEWLEGEAVWRWRDGDGRWSAPLLEAALACSHEPKPGPVESVVRRPAAFLIEYSDGLRAASYMLEGKVRDFLFAARLRGRPEPAATRYVLGGPRPLPHFDGLVRCIEEFFVSGRPVYPVERTLLTTGALAFLFESRARKAPVPTPELAVRYRAPRDTWFERG